MDTTNIPKTMKAVQVVAYKSPYQLTDIPVPAALSPHDLLVKVAAASYCHTDRIFALGVMPSLPLPRTASHEGSGVVVAAGAAASTRFKPGDRVMCGVPVRPCGACAECAGPEAYTHYCTHQGLLGLQADGCLAEYVRADARSSVAVPDAVSLLSAAPLACAGRSAWRGVRQAGLAKGRWLAVVGAGGGLGHLAVQFAKAAGLRVVGIEARDEGLEVARRYGADVVLDARRGVEEVVAEVEKATGGVRADATVNLADAEGAAALACAVTRMHGTMHQIAQPNEVKIPFMELMLRDVRVRGSLTCSPDEGREMLEHIAEHGIELESNFFYGLDKISEAVELAHSGKIKGKAVIIVDEAQIEHDKEIGAKY